MYIYIYIHSHTHTCFIYVYVVLCGCMCVSRHVRAYNRTDSHVHFRPIVCYKHINNARAYTRSLTCLLKYSLEIPQTYTRVRMHVENINIYTHAHLYCHTVRTYMHSCIHAYVHMYMLTYDSMILIVCVPGITIISRRNCLCMYAYVSIYSLKVLIYACMSVQIYIQVW